MNSLRRTICVCKVCTKRLKKNSWTRRIIRRVQLHLQLPKDVLEKIYEIRRLKIFYSFGGAGGVGMPETSMLMFFVVLPSNVFARMTSVISNPTVSLSASFTALSAPTL